MPEDRISAPKGTASGHCMQLIGYTMDITDVLPEMHSCVIWISEARQALFLMRAKRVQLVCNPKVSLTQFGFFI